MRNAARQPSQASNDADGPDNGPDNAAPGPGKQTLTASRLDVAKAQLSIGNGEDGHHRAGGMYARSANLALISADPQQRAEHLLRVLRTGVGNRHSFEQITPWLMGTQHAELAAAFQTLAKVSLTDAITRAFSQPFMRSYLLDVAEHGEPALASRLAMASGLVTSTRSDWPEVLRLLRAAEPDDVTKAIADPTLKRHLETSARVKAVIDVSGKQQAHDQATEAVTTAKDGGDAEAITTAEAGAQTTKEALYKAKNTELVAIVHHRQQVGRGLDRDKLAADLSAWAKANDKEIRDQATQPGSPFVAALDAQAAAKSPAARLGAPDRAYLIAVAQGGAPVADEVLKPEPPAAAPAPGDDAVAKTPDELAAEAKEKQDKRDKDAEDAGLKVGELDAYLDRKTASNHALKHQHWSTLKAKIEGLDDDQRAIYLRQQMTPAQRAIFDGADSTAEQRAEARGQAMATIRTRLLTTGMSAAVADRVMAAFQTGAAPDSVKYHSTYQKLRRLALGGPTLMFSRQAMKLVGQLANQEYLQVRDDSAVMTALQARCDAATWAQITAVLGHDAAGTVNPDGLTGKQARERASNEAELEPAHWTALLQRELAKNPLSQHEDKVLSVATRAYYAAQRRAGLPTGDDGRKPELPRGLAPMSVPAFTAEVLAKLSTEERTQLEREDPAGYQALRSGRAVSANERIGAATFSVLSPKRLKGTDARPSDIQRAVDDAQGRELLEEWSNVADWRTLQAARAKQADGTPRAAELDAQMRAFVVDINPEVHAQLKRLLPRDKLVTVQTKLREKLGKAMKDDPSFRAAMVVANLPTDGHAQERTKGLAALDQQRLENSGAQWNSLIGIGVSAKSAEGKESSNVLAGKLRSAHQTIEVADDKEAARAQVNDDQVADITKAREEHADRMKSAQALKKRANEIATTVVTILSGIAITGATFGTGGLLFAPQVGIALGKALAAGVLKGALKRALDGDKFNAVDTISSITLDLMVTSVMTAGIGAPTGVTEHAEVAAGLKGKKDAASLFADAGLKWAVNTGVREAISTTTTAMMDPDPKKLTLGQEAMVRLRAWVEDFALTMASTEAGRHTTGETQAQKDTTKLIPGTVKPVTAELTRPIDDKVKAERRVMGKPMAIKIDPVPASGVSAEQLTEGRDQLRASPGPRAPLAPTTAHDVTQDELVGAHAELQPAAQNVPLEPVRAEVVRSRALANELARHLTAHAGQLAPALIVQGQAALVDLRMRIDQVQTALAMGGTTRAQNQLAVTQLQVLYARADDANTNIMVAALSAAMPAVPTHAPVAAPPAHTEERQAEAMLS